MGPTWVLLAPDGPHVGPMNLAIWDRVSLSNWEKIDCVITASHYISGTVWSIMTEIYFCHRLVISIYFDAHQSSITTAVFCWPLSVELHQFKPELHTSFVKFKINTELQRNLNLKCVKCNLILNVMLFMNCIFFLYYRHHQQIRCFACTT